MGNRTNLIVAGILIIVAVGYLIVSNTSSTTNYFLTINEVLSLPPEETERALTVSGAVLGNTIAYTPTIPQVTFTIVEIPGDLDEIEQQGGLAKVLYEATQDPDAARLEIIYPDVKPELLTDRAQAIIRGKLGDHQRFYADEVLLKCPSRYEEALPDQAEKIP